jgi:hypothetical protein
MSNVRDPPLDDRLASSAIDPCISNLSRRPEPHGANFQFFVLQRCPDFFLYALSLRIDKIRMIDTGCAPDCRKTATTSRQTFPDIYLILRKNSTAHAWLRSHISTGNHS